MLFNYVRNLDFEQKPEYSYMKKGIKSVLDSLVPHGQIPILDWHNNKNVYLILRLRIYRVLQVARIKERSNKFY